MLWKISITIIKWLLILNNFALQQCAYKFLVAQTRTRNRNKCKLYVLSVFFYINRASRCETKCREKMNIESQLVDKCYMLSIRFTGFEALALDLQAWSEWRRRDGHACVTQLLRDCCIIMRLHLSHDTVYLPMSRKLWLPAVMPRCSLI